MSQVSEIKCPNCGEWSKSTDKVDEKCMNCGEYLEPERLSHESEKRLLAGADKTQSYYLIKDSDETIVQLFKLFINSFMWGSYYTMLLFFIFITALLVAFGLLAA